MQRDFSSTIMRPFGSGDAMERSSAATAAKWIKPNARMSACERLDIYNQQYWWRLLGAFADDFPGLRWVLGERKFDHLAATYLEAYGSTSWSLRDLGQHLEKFLIQHPELVAPRGALALDMARVEWARVLAFDGPEKPPLDPQRLARTPPSKVRLRLQPFLSLLRMQYPVDTLLHRLKVTEHANVARSVRAAARPLHLAVHRVGFSVFYKRLPLEAFTLLTALHSGATLGDACAASCATAANIQMWFSEWMSLGWPCLRKPPV